MTVLVMFFNALAVHNKHDRHRDRWVVGETDEHSDYYNFSTIDADLTHVKSYTTFDEAVEDLRSRKTEKGMP